MNTLQIIRGIIFFIALTTTLAFHRTLHTTVINPSSGKEVDIKPIYPGLLWTIFWILGELDKN